MIFPDEHGETYLDRRRQRDDPEGLRHDVRGRGRDRSTAARSADEGLALARQARPDLIVADGAMPGRTGYDLCAQVRADAALRGMPVYILASSQQPYDEARGQGAGADGHFIKPWDTAAFIEKVYAAAGGPPPSRRRPRACRQPRSPPRRWRTTTTARSASIVVGAGDAAADRDRRARRWPRRPAPQRVDARGRWIARRPARGAAMRPSLIPGMRPGAMPPARPGTAPVRPLGGPAAPTPRACRRVPAAPPVGRTMIGLPAAGVPIPGAPAPGRADGAAHAVADRPGGAAVGAAGRPVMSFAPPAAAPRPRAMTPPMVTPPPVPASTARTREMTPAPPVRRGGDADAASDLHPRRRRSSIAVGRRSEAGGHQRQGARVRGDRQAVARDHRADGLGGGPRAGRGDHPRAARQAAPRLGPELASRCRAGSPGPGARIALPRSLALAALIPVTRGSSAASRFVTRPRAELFLGRGV